MNKVFKYLFLYITGGTLYTIVELIYRGFSHWTMFLLGGSCFVILGLINVLLSWDTALWIQSLIGGCIVTALEFLTGCIVNLWLGWDVWNYTKFDVIGQISLPFFFIWCGLSVVAIILDDYIRYWIFYEDKPKYKIF